MPTCPATTGFTSKTEDHLTKNDHFRALLETARARGLRPHGGGIRQLVREPRQPQAHPQFRWTWLTQLKSFTRQSLAERGWMIEVYHRSLEQTCGVECCQARSGRAQRNHIGFAIRAFVGLERHLFRTGISEWEAKARIVRDGVRAYLASPRYTLASTA